MKPLHYIQSALNIPLNHFIGIGIVVDMFVPLIGTNHVIDLVNVKFRM